MGAMELDAKYAMQVYNSVLADGRARRPVGDALKGKGTVVV